MVLDWVFRLRTRLSLYASSCLERRAIFVIPGNRIMRMTWEDVLIKWKHILGNNSNMIQ
jgi:hypothetical protein